MNESSETNPCRICGSSATRSFERRHEMECCEACVSWVAEQPVVYPEGTERALEAVRWWDLRNLYMAKRFDGKVARVALTSRQVTGFILEKYINQPLDKN